ncbi:hypothetical protein [Paraburkholderia tuberum]|uniref:Uncharacterized protein n=1 Tax=Paraburkholderia tuberum TaxID=157910 RepID=A0A1H1KJP8_9BURK|nr:hypothetical protein [Paraburkholderia tuberum]SDR62523.1 hypothetical protein SAMN05445850_8243 [Paraburkholderia tuberum]
METDSVSLAGLRSLDCYPEMFSERERRQVDEWITGGLVVKAEGDRLNITQAGEQAYWSQFPGQRAQEVVDVLDENIVGVLEDAERGLSLADLATRWSGGVLLLTGHDVLSAFDRWRAGQWKYGGVDSVVERSRVVAACERFNNAQVHQ